jgi:hypothetical protein
MSRTAKHMIAYVPEALGGGTVTWTTASDKYEYAGFVYGHDGAWHVVVQGWSKRSVIKRTLAQARNMRADASPGKVGFTAMAYETTAPVIAEYFEDHRVTVGAIFRPGRGWEEGSWLAGRSSLRSWAKEGVTTVAVHRAGRVADFQMTEVLRSLNTRRASA